MANACWLVRTRGASRASAKGEQRLAEPRRRIKADDDDAPKPTTGATTERDEGCERAGRREQCFVAAGGLDGTTRTRRTVPP